MTRVMSFKRLMKSFSHALRGMWHVFLSEGNFRIQLIFAVLVVVFSLMVNLAVEKLIVVLLSITLLLVLEMMNTAFERMIDIVQPRFHEYARKIKDISAGAVLLAALSCFFIIVLVLFPEIFMILKRFFE